MKIASFMALGMVFVAASAEAQTVDPTGTYISATGRTKVRVTKCGSTHCGTIVSVTGEAKDVNNPDPAKRGRNLVGLQMMSDIKPAREGYTGQLYNFRDGKTYAGKATIDGNGMNVSGCVLGGLICRSHIWTRVN